MRDDGGSLIPINPCKAVTPQTPSRHSKTLARDSGDNICLAGHRICSTALNRVHQLNQRQCPNLKGAQTSRLLSERPMRPQRQTERPERLRSFEIRTMTTQPQTCEIAES